MSDEVDDVQSVEDDVTPEAPPIVEEQPEDAQVVQIDTDHVVAKTGVRDRVLVHNGVSYEHVGDTPDGCWIYRAM